MTKDKADLLEQYCYLRRISGLGDLLELDDFLDIEWFVNSSDQQITEHIVMLNGVLNLRGLKLSNHEHPDMFTVCEGSNEV